MKAKRVLWAAAFYSATVVISALACVGAVAVYDTWIAPEQTYMLMSNHAKTEFCPVPIIHREPRPECLYSTQTAHLICDCSSAPKAARPEFERLLAFARQHPLLPGERLIAPILPGEAAAVH